MRRNLIGHMSLGAEILPWDTNMVWYQPNFLNWSVQQSDQVMTEKEYYLWLNEFL